MWNSAALLGGGGGQQDGIVFRTSKAGSNVNFFANGGSVCPGPENFAVYLNSQKTSQDYRSISFAEGDIVAIVLKNRKSYYPYFKPGDGGGNNILDYVREMLAPLPLMQKDSNTPELSFDSIFRNCYTFKVIPNKLFAYNPQVTDISSCFSYCTGLTVIPDDIFKYNTQVRVAGWCFFGCRAVTEFPSDLFRYNTQVSDFTGCFYGCDAVTTFPEDLFRYNTRVSTFAQCFMYCINLNTIPMNLFLYNTEVTSFYACFLGSHKLLTYSLKIGSAKVYAGNANAFSDDYNASKITIKVPTGSTSYTAFKNWKGSNTKITIQTY